ncbi:MAG: aldehyde dehydrogenase family protein [Bryobacteraceae bacterium]|nr:aldehyde dehydrogenase family protein [Bryobacteraceae bacterium]
MLHIPILRQGQPYKSVDLIRTANFRTKEPFVEISQANAGLIRRDLLNQDEMRDSLMGFSTRDLLAIAKQAGQHFMNDALPLGESTQTPQQYVEALSATTGMPYVMVRANMRKIFGVLDQMEAVLNGLTRLPSLDVLDRGWGDVAGTAVSFFRRASALGVVLPNNSPGVHSLWAPAFAMKTALMLKPGSAEPWTPYRMIQALLKAGAPAKAFGYYPADHGGGAEILRGCGRGMVFGDVAATKRWESDPRVEVHGPGYSKVIFGEDEADNWEKYIDVIAASIASNSGRSCVNASGVWTPRNGARIAQALAAKLASIEPRPADAEDAQISPFADPKVAERISAIIDQDLPGAVDVTASMRPGPRYTTFEGCGYLLPTIVTCSVDHPLANREFLFPFASVVELPQDQILEAIGPSLVVTVISNDPKFRQQCLTSENVGRLNFGPIPTMQISWDQPHEGNLFDHLFARRAFQAAS